MKIPVTAKIRVFDDIEKSVEYAKMCEKAGIAVNEIEICYFYTIFVLNSFY